MRRREFIISSILSGIGFSSSGIGFFDFDPPNITDEELTGRAVLNFIDPTIKLRKAAYKDFKSMQMAAMKDGIGISAVSAYRSYADQKRIWDRKYNSYVNDGLEHNDVVKKIIEYSTIPGTSRHHWGTDVDIIDSSVPAPKNVLSSSHFAEDGVYGPLKAWMNIHSEKFNFYLVYTDHPKRKGFKFEPWHYSYKPLSHPYLKSYLDRNLISGVCNTNFKGAELLSKNFIEQYYAENILDINPVLL